MGKSGTLLKPPNASTDSGQDRSNGSDASEDEEDDDTSSSSGSSSSSSSRSDDGNDTDASSGGDKSDDEGNDNQDDAASPTASPSDASEFPDKEPVVSQDLADYIEEHGRVLEESRRDFEWTESSFFSQNGSIELQHDTFQVQNTGSGALQGEKKLRWDDSVPATPAPKLNDTFSTAKEIIISDDDSAATELSFLSPSNLTEKTMPLQGTPYPIGTRRQGGE